MAGVLFIISIPTSETEKSKLKNKRSVVLVSDELSPVQISNDSTKTNDFSKANGDTRDFLEISEKSSTHSSKDTINSQQSKSNSSDSVGLITTAESIQDDAGTDGRIADKPQLGVGSANGPTKKTKSCESLVETNPLTDDPNAANRKSFSGTGRDSTNSCKKEKLPPEKKLEKIDLGDVTLPINSTMEEVLRDTLRNMKILNAAWIKTNRETSFQIMFSMESTLQCENFLRIMNEWGIGEREGTSVSMMPCTFYHKPHEELDLHEQKNTAEDNKDSAWDRFLQSIRARLNVATIVEEVKKDASITFDFLCLVVIAAILAAFGLVENSTVFLVSSMLISPLMGPIIATIFGSVIKDYKLMKMGIVNELIGIFLATFAGFVFGLVQCTINEKYGIGDGVSAEMMSRCEFRSLAVGIFTALPSGAAVAIAILGENIGSLVGVAISASLLPPAVNAGLMWSLSVVYAVFQHDETKFTKVANTNLYSNHQSVELFALGTMSMGLTIINILCIYVMGVAVLKIKEVAPINSRNQKQFWKHDIKIARDYYKTCQNEDAAALGKKIADEIAGFTHHEPTDGSTLHHRKSMLSPNQCTWSPLTNRNQYTMMQNNEKPPMQDLETLFHTITPQPTRPMTFRRPSMMGKSMSPPITNRDIYNLLSHHDHLGHDYRRQSHPFEHLTVHHCGSTYRNHNTTPLDKIIENIHSANGKTKSESHEIDIESNATDALLPSDGANKRKFIVTPAADPLFKE